VSQWFADVDATLMGQFTWAGAGLYEAAGLESRASAAIVPANSISQLRYSGSFAPFQPWDGQDDKWVGTGTCGHWLGDTGWVNAENSSC